MSSIMIAYAAISAVWFFAFTFLWLVDDDGPRVFARLALAAPVWPGMIIVGFVSLVLALVKDAIRRREPSAGDR